MNASTRTTQRRTNPAVLLSAFATICIWAFSATMTVQAIAKAPGAPASHNAVRSILRLRGGVEDMGSIRETFLAMHERMMNSQTSETPGAFLAALDQSGGSTPKALQAYGLGPSEGNYEVGTTSMFDAVHAMRTRIVTSPCFSSDSILGAILFEDTMDRTIDSVPTCQYLWETKGIVPFLKIDKGLRTIEAKDVEDGGIELVQGEASVQMLRPIPELEALLNRAKSLGVYGTKARSVILDPQHPEQIDALVKQQFALARRVLECGLVPIVEPEVDVTQASTDKQECEAILCRALLRELDLLQVECPGKQVMLKITLPEREDQYLDCVNHPACLKVVALSGGYDRAEANRRLARNTGVIASFSRALSEGLHHSLTPEDFDACLAESLASISEASAASATTASSSPSSSSASSS